MGKTYIVNVVIIGRGGIKDGENRIRRSMYMYRTCIIHANLLTVLIVHWVGVVVFTLGGCGYNSLSYLPTALLNPGSSSSSSSSSSSVSSTGRQETCQTGVHTAVYGPGSYSILVDYRNILRFIHVHIIIMYSTCIYTENSNNSILVDYRKKYM